MDCSHHRKHALICLVRHGETDWNRAGRLQGHTDTPLNSKGRQQALEVARSLAREPWDALYSSHLERALETAAIIGDVLDLSPRADRNLSERFFGGIHGLTAAEMDREFPWHRRSRLGITQMEPDEAFRLRIREVMTRIGRRHLGEKVILVTHGGFMRSFLLNDLLHSGIPQSVGNCEAQRVRYLGPGLWVPESPELNGGR